LKAVQEWGLGHKGARESSRRARINQSNVYSQQGFIEKSTWTSALILIMKGTVKYSVWGEYLWERGGWMKEIKVKVYGGWTSYSSMK
jgi:hypothetical protein